MNNAGVWQARTTCLDKNSKPRFCITEAGLVDWQASCRRTEWFGLRARSVDQSAFTVKPLDGCVNNRPPSPRCYVEMLLVGECPCAQGALPHIPYSLLLYSLEHFNFAKVWML